MNILSCVTSSPYHRAPVRGPGLWWNFPGVQMIGRRLEGRGRQSRRCQHVAIVLCRETLSIKGNRDTMYSFRMNDSMTSVSGRMEIEATPLYSPRVYRSRDTNMAPQ